jgi:hypothetical protein
MNRTKDQEAFSNPHQLSMAHHQPKLLDIPNNLGILNHRLQDKLLRQEYILKFLLLLEAYNTPKVLPQYRWLQ